MNHDTVQQQHNTTHDEPPPGAAGNVSSAAVVSSANEAGCGGASDSAPNLIRFPYGGADWSMGSEGVEVIPSRLNHGNDRAPTHIVLCWLDLRVSSTAAFDHGAQTEKQT